MIQRFGLTGRKSSNPGGEVTKNEFILWWLILTPRLPDISKIIKKHVHLLGSSPTLEDLFLQKSIILAYRSSKNPKQIIAPSKVKRPSRCEQVDQPGYFKCDGKCDLCKQFMHKTTSFRNFATRRTNRMKHSVSCTTTNVIYISRMRCKLQYVGYKSTQFKVCFRNHKSALATEKSCEMAVHFSA